jgi:hypothetical protein
VGNLNLVKTGNNKVKHGMTIQEIVDVALKNGYLTPTMEAEVGRICDNASELSVEEYQALDKLMGALLTGQITAVPRKQFINVMEELVLTEAITRVSEVENSSNITLDLGDIAAFALNRLPPLYATTEEGANYQRERAQEELKDIIAQQVETAIARNLDKPEFFPERTAITASAQQGENLLSQMNSLLQDYAPEFAEPIA